MNYKTVTEAIAVSIGARTRCAKSEARTVWYDRHSKRLRAIQREYLPSGSGFDDGTRIDLEKSTDNKLVLFTAFHHMDDNGAYCGWTSHTVIVTPSLTAGFDVRVTGKNKRDIKDYIAETFSQALGAICVVED